MSNSSNPLAKHFRQPSIYLSLPSKGKFYGPGALEYPKSGELPVYPMTVKDEITLKTPDALMNGEGVVEVVKSCVPNIKNPWQIPVCDLDTVLIAIRIASYGNEMSIGTNCPKCKEINENVVDLSMYLDSLPEPVYAEKGFGKLIVKFKPQDYEALNKANLASYRQQSLLRTISSDTLTDEQRQAEFKRLLPQVTELTVQNLLNGIESIVTEDGQEVKEKLYIKEFLDNCDLPTYETIRKTVEEIVVKNRSKPVDIKCEHCEDEYKADVTFEHSNFFG